MTSAKKELITKTFNELRADNLSILDHFYHPEVVFIDPIGTVKTLPALKAYYKGMYKNVQEIAFDFDTLIEEKNEVSSTWSMRLKARGLNGGREVVVNGTSHLSFDQDTQLVIAHRDYFDMGEFIYEYIPLLKTVIKAIKNKIGH